MKNGYLFWGLVLILTGLIFILKETGIINITWQHIWFFWPLVLIFLGISLLPLNNRSKVTVYIVVLLLSVFLIYYCSVVKPSYIKNFNKGLFQWKGGDNDDEPDPPVIDKDSSQKNI